jgi:hypothetical protein
MKLELSRLQLCLVGARSSRAAPGRGDPLLPLQSRSVPIPSKLLRHNCSSVLLFAYLLAGTLTGERGFHAFLLAGLEVKGVALHFFNDVFLLHLALKTAQSVFEGFTLLQSNFRQTDTPPSSSGRTGA